MPRAPAMVMIGLLVLGGCRGAPSAGADGGAPGPADAGTGADGGGTTADGGGTTADGGGTRPDGGSACPGNAVLSYPNAIHDTAYRPQPAPPTLGPAGSIVTDPVFGSRILRVTDADTMVGTSTRFQGRDFLTPSSSEINTFNADDTKFVVNMSSGQIIAYDLDPKSLTATCIKSYPHGSTFAPPATGCANLPVGSEFSYTNPDWIYGTRTDSSGHLQLSRYDFGTGATTDLLDLNAVIGSVPAHNYALDINASATERLNVSFGDTQGKAPYDLVYDVSTGAHHLLDVAHSTIDGQPLGWSILGQSGGGTGIHNAQLSMDGGYVMLTIAGATNAAAGHLVWDVNRGTAYWMTTSPLGHFILGYGRLINQDNIRGNSDKNVSFLMRGLGQGDIGSPVSLLPVVSTGTYFPDDSHPSWNNDRPCVPVPSLASFDFYSPTTKLAYDGEIDAFATDGSGTLWRFAFNYTVDDGDFYDESRGNVSQDGRLFMFTSNWGGTLGSDGRIPRRDVFIVDLMSAHR